MRPHPHRSPALLAVLGLVAAWLLAWPLPARALSAPAPAPAHTPAPLLAALLHLGGSPPADLGLQDGRLRPCASPAHCARQDWPLADPGAAMEHLSAVLEGTPGVRIVSRIADPAPRYLHATSESRIFGFVDDLELAPDPRGHSLQVRSESRLGDSDLGVNARRLADLRASLSPADGG